MLDHEKITGEVFDIASVWQERQWPTHVHWVLEGMYAEDVLRGALWVKAENPQASVGVILPAWGDETISENRPLSHLIWPSSWVPDGIAKKMLQNLGYGDARYPFDRWEVVEDVMAKLFGSNPSPQLVAVDRREVIERLLNLALEQGIFLCPEVHAEWISSRKLLVWGPSDEPVRVKNSMHVGRRRRHFLVFHVEGVPEVLRDLVVWESPRGELYILERTKSHKTRIFVEGWDPRILGKTDEVKQELLRIFPTEVDAYFLGTVSEGDGRAGFSPRWDFPKGQIHAKV